MTRPTCQFREWAYPRGCRKRATRAVQHRVIFGHQVTGKGDVAVYTQRVAFCCAEHEPPEKTAELPIAEYQARLAAAQVGKEGAQ